MLKLKNKKPTNNRNSAFPQHTLPHFSHIFAMGSKVGCSRRARNIADVYFNVEIKEGLHNIADLHVSVETNSQESWQDIADRCFKVNMQRMLRSISEISSCFFGPRPWHIEIRHRVKQTSTINLCGFETLKLKI